jgi:type II secretory pathway pseudopilin PulG
MKISYDMQRVGQEHGFSILEVMITLAVCSLAVAGMLATNSVLQKSSAVTHSRLVAVQDANQVIEQMREAAAYGTFPSNLQSAFPNNTLLTNFTNLKDEKIQVQYASPSADPLDVMVQVQWMGPDNRPAVYSLHTLMTQRE